jgi:hypothetical protein
MEADHLRTFIFGWTALEIFINKVFSRYGGDFVSSGARVPETSRYSERITRAIENDKYPLLDKFAIIAAVLMSESVVSDVDEYDRVVNEFQGMKDVRDTFFHGQDVPETSLPNVELQSLFAEFLRRHVDYTRPS